MKRNVPVSTIMTADPFTVHVAQPLADVARALSTRSFHHVPVVDGARVVGMLSSTDVLKASYTWGQDARQATAVLDHTASIAGLMTEEPVTLDAHQPIRRAFELLAEGTYHALPITRDGALVGIVTTTDLLRYALDQY